MCTPTSTWPRSETRSYSPAITTEARARPTTSARWRRMCLSTSAERVRTRWMRPSRPRPREGFQRHSEYRIRHPFVVDNGRRAKLEGQEIRSYDQSDQGHGERGQRDLERQLRLRGHRLLHRPGHHHARVVQPGGDSGSLVVVDGKGKTRGDDGKPVGLLFAGSPLSTIISPIDPILDHFGVTIDGN